MVSTEYENDPRNQMPTELLRTDEGVTVSVDTGVPETEQEALWSMVQAGFIDLNRKSFEKQDMTHEELLEDFSSPNVYKYVARDDQSAPIGLLTIHVGFDDIVWTDTQKMREVQDAADPAAVPYYVGTLVVPPDLRGTETATTLLKGAFLHFQQVNQANNMHSLVFFDCADANDPWLAEYVEKTGNEALATLGTHAKVTELDTDAWQQTQDGVVKVPYKEQLDPATVLDKQHYYSIDIANQA